jgi:hypothetical protein
LTHRCNEHIEEGADEIWLILGLGTLLSDFFFKLFSLRNGWRAAPVRLA